MEVLMLSFRTILRSTFILALGVGAADLAQARGLGQTGDRPQTQREAQGQTDTIASATQLAALARDARTAAQHADVARRYRLQADALDARAAEHAARASALVRTAPGIAHKWPAMAPRALSQAKQDAIEARRAARESRELASRHHAIAVETLAAEKQ